MKLPKELTTVTPLSKTLIFILFIILPITGFFLGKEYQRLSGITQTQVQQYVSGNTVNPNDATSTPTNKLLHIITPKAGEKLCLGEYYNIRWQVPPETQGITLKIAEAENGNTVHNIGNFPNNYGGSQPGTGLFSWKVGFNRDGVNIIPGPGYHILINGIYKQYSLTNVSDYFTITTCSK